MIEPHHGEPTTWVCPESPHEEYHFLIPRGPSAGRSMTCKYCGKSEKQLRTAEEQGDLLHAHAKQVVDAAPPLSPEQIEALKTLIEAGRLS